MDWSSIPTVAAGFFLGALLTWWFIRSRILRELEKSLNESTLRDVVATTRMEAQLKDFEDLNLRFTESQQKLLAAEPTEQIASTRRNRSPLMAGRWSASAWPVSRSCVAEWGGPLQLHPAPGRGPPAVIFLPATPT